MKYVFLLISLFAQMSLASVQDEVAVLKDVPRDYLDTGSICEEVARQETIKEYPAPQYEVLSGIAYETQDGTDGELDVIVFDKNSNQVIQIAEVKCWQKMDHALKKAHEQRVRFFDLRDNAQIITFRSTHGNKIFTPDQFAYVKEFVTIGQKGSLEFGFDRTLPYTLNELMELRDLMMKCQQQKRCAVAKP
ncbi:MAG: hypothetical protein ACM3MG_05450 [Bacillota bacterium]